MFPSSTASAHPSSFNNPDKGAITHAIVHRAVWEYMLAVRENPDEAERERQIKELFEKYVHIPSQHTVLMQYPAARSSSQRWSTRRTAVE